MAVSFDESEFEAFRSEDSGDLLHGRDYLFFLLDNLDWESQLSAVRMMLSRNRDAEAAFAKFIEQDEEEVRAHSGPHHHHYVDQHVDLLHESVYRDAAESMAAIGMIAPMVESTLGQSFAALGEMHTRKGISPPEHKRWRRAKGHASRWNCQVYYDKDGKPNNNIILGFPQLSAASGLDAFVSPEFLTWFEAMFTYRNFMFHGGFEWSLDRRQAFQETIDTKKWDEFFTCSTSNGSRWIFYVAADAINRMPGMVEIMLDSLAAFAKSLPFELVSEL